jgi:UDPglucose--hexose-1-phosphate uridylyltransferase
VPTAGVTAIATSLADGRDLIYYDDADSSLGSERAIDTRALDARPATATMRLDILSGDWISVAASRQNRVMLPPAELDPLAPQSESNRSEIPSVYDVAVFENRSPSFGPGLADSTNAPTGLDDLDAPDLDRTRASIGRCEVVCFSPNSTGSLSTLGTSRMRTVIEAWANRTAALSAMPGVEQVFPFENRGEAIGVTLHHPHGQIYAYPYITPRTARTLDMIDRTAPDLFARILESERHGERIVIAGEHWSAFVPFAARWPIEVHLMPHEHVADLAETTQAQREELAVLQPLLLRALDALYDSPTPYIAAWHQAPVHRARDTYRLHLQLTSPRRAADKLKFLAGSEAAMGAWVADVHPEQAAAAIREAIDRS